MSMDLRELYQEIILDHNKNPRNHHPMADATQTARGFNPLCGDKLTVYLKIQDEKIEDLSFVGCGCAISQASASLMTEALMHKSIEEAQTLYHRIHALLTEEKEAPLAVLDKLSVLAGVRAFPARVKCATLAWHTLEAALKKQADLVSTE
jgi:nitrogen fixation protein NifU and related proteins